MDNRLTAKLFHTIVVLGVGLTAVGCGDDDSGQTTGSTQQRGSGTSSGSTASNGDGGAPASTSGTPSTGTPSTSGDSTASWSGCG